MTTEIVQATPGDVQALKFLDHLSRKNGHCVGFLPLVAYMQALDNGRVSLLFYNDEPAGYMIRGPIKKTTKIYQLVVAEELRRIENGTALLDRLRRQATAESAHEITLHCAEDLDANYFWRQLGFEQIGRRLKDRTGKRWQNRYRQNLPEKQLAQIRQKARITDRNLAPLARLMLKGKLDVAALLENAAEKRARRT